MVKVSWTEIESLIEIVYGISTVVLLDNKSKELNQYPTYIEGM